MKTIPPILTVPIINYVILAVLFIFLYLFITKKWDTVKTTLDSGADSPSQKRFAIFISLMLICIMVFLALLLNIQVPDYIWFGVLGIVLTGLGLTVWEKTKMQSLKNNNNELNQTTKTE